MLKIPVAEVMLVLISVDRQRSQTFISCSAESDTDPLYRPEDPSGDQAEHFTAGTISFQPGIPPPCPRWDLCRCSGRVPARCQHLLATRCLNAGDPGLHRWDTPTFPSRGCLRRRSAVFCSLKSGERERTTADCNEAVEGGWRWPDPVIVKRTAQAATVGLLPTIWQLKTSRERDAWSRVRWARDHYLVRDAVCACAFVYWLARGEPARCSQVRCFMIKHWIGAGFCRPDRAYWSDHLHPHMKSWEHPSTWSFTAMPQICPTSDIIGGDCPTKPPLLSNHFCSICCYEYTYQYQWVALQH